MLAIQFSYSRFDENYDAFSVVFNAVSMFIGCVWAHGYQLVCYLGPSEYNRPNNQLYKIGNPCSQCIHEDKCTDPNFKNLCSKFMICIQSL